MNCVCAVIVTYNRPELLCRCVEHLLSQTYPLDILIYDNHSSTDTIGKLNEVGLIKENVRYFYASENTGGSGGFHNGMKMAISMGYESLLLMDDDGYPLNEKTVEFLVNAKERNGNLAIYNSLVVCDADTLQLSFSLDRIYDGNVIRSRAVDGLVEEYISPFNGTLVSSELIKKIGYPIKEFFVYGDETEYTYRAKKYGAKLYTVVDSVYFHPTNVGNLKKIFGFYISVSDIPMWKVYCSSRNSTYYLKQYFGKRAVVKSIIRAYINVIFVKKNKLKRFKYVTKGIIDGSKGDFSKKIDLTK